MVLVGWPPCTWPPPPRPSSSPAPAADLLLNFVAANWTAHSEEELPAPVQLVRPRRRLDLSRLSGVGERCRAVWRALVPPLCMPAC